MVERDHLAISPKGEDAKGERSAEEIRQDIAAKRESITDTVDRLSDKVQRTFDWRTYVAEYPLLAFGLAIGAGLLVSRMFIPKPTPRERILDALAETVEDLKERFGEYIEAVPTAKKSAIGTTVKAAATGVLTKAATDFVKNKIIAQRHDQEAAQDNGRTRGIPIH
ncbi:MAG: DUF3618 domain-containing protein [Acidobacteria bacterium]|nr:DUF3618 domain-containing protein [Acidobacteriota bacterium]